MRRLLPAVARERVRFLLERARRAVPLARTASSEDYRARLESEQRTFAGQVEVHELPPIFHYWSNRYLRPINEEFGFSHPEQFIEVRLATAYDHARKVDGSKHVRFVSLGSGNCDAEVRIAKILVASGRSEFVLECLDINPDMLARGRALAHQSGVERQVVPVLGDFNRWVPTGHYQAVLANQSLHHVVELEHLFDAIATGLAPDGEFVVSDMIGRNGHRRWPEALEIVQEFWSEMPPSYRFNRQLQRQEDTFMDWDCSVEGFEGIRAQDILPLMLQRFGFRMFLAYGNVIDPFIDRGFGHNFDADGEWDREFIDRIHARDEAGIMSGQVKPTHMLAVLCNDRSVQPAVWKHLTPEFCVRVP